MTTEKTKRLSSRRDLLRGFELLRLIEATREMRARANAIMSELGIPASARLVGISLEEGEIRYLEIGANGTAASTRSSSAGQCSGGRRTEKPSVPITMKCSGGTRKKGRSAKRGKSTRSS